MEKKRLIISILFIMIFSIAILFSFLYSKDKYTVSFETGTSEAILDKYVNKNETVDMPLTPIKEGYIFKEWQLDGKKYNFSNKIKSNITLTAKWIKKEYVKISFLTYSEYNIDSIKVLKGDIVGDLPIPRKDNYEFIGWYLNGILFSDEEIYSDIVLNAEYKNDRINTTYKIGDTVTIIGNYSNKSDSLIAYNKKAIGWKRKILNIMDGENYPYVLGDDTGITGFFKAESFQK